MNKNIAKYLLSLAVVALAGGGCEVNDFNDGLDGFEGRPLPGDTQTIALTLSAADYSSISSNKDNLALAKELGPDAEAALKAIGTNKFIDGDDAQLYMPAFLASKYSYLDNRSAVEVSYINKNQGSEVITKTLANQYALEDADYNGAWGADHDSPFFTPKKPAEQFMPDVLKAKIKDAKSGDYAIASYNFSLEEPTTAPTAKSSTPGITTRADVAVKKISDINFSGKEKATAEGIVIGLHAQGVLFQDESGIALLFNKALTPFSLGDKIRVSGTTQLRNGVNQFDKDGGVAEFLSHPVAEFAYPAIAAEITKDNIQTFSTAAAHVSMTGTLKVDGIYMNIHLDGMDPTVFRGSLSYVFPSMEMASLNDKEITVTGYYLGNSGSSTKNFTLMVTSAKEVNGSADITPIGVAANKAGTYTSKGIVTGLYNKGFLMNDGTGSILVFQDATPTAKIGQVATVTGTTAFNFSMAQFGKTSTITLGAQLTASHPTPTVISGTAVDEYVAAPVYTYASFEGKLIKNGNFYQVKKIAGTEKYGSFSNPLPEQAAELDKLLNKTVSVTGYLIGSHVQNGYFSVMFGSIEQIIRFETSSRYGVYTYNGSSWDAVEPKDALAVNQADYLEMGISNMYFDKTNTVDKYVFPFLNKTLPYAQADQAVTLFYNYKESDAAYMMGSVYKFDGTRWTQNFKTEQYVKGSGKWKFNPSPTIVVAPDKSAFSAKIYQAVVDYVIANKHAAYTTKDGTPLTKSEFYSGCASDYTNLNWRINTLPWYYWKVAEGEEAVKVYEDWSSTDKTKQKAAYQAFYTEVEKRFGEVMSSALSTLYPSAAIMPDVEIIYTIQMMVYTQHISSSTGRVTHAFEFKLVDTGKFEYKGMYALDAKYELMNEDNFK